MIYRLLADAVLLLHLAFIVFVVAGSLFLLRWPRLFWLPWLHLPAVLWGVGIELGGYICPLTPLENRLRQMGGEAGYAGGFVEHYFLPFIYPAGLTRGLQIALGLGLVAINLAAYACWWRQRRK
ncbi:MAG: DUF2784 domain-containing protein [Rhodocyclaceae bacterium]|nr:DUF2784 domain-containing protein [Rhodocyclaceae bacterium]MDZ4214338.1 DUF2784 domain-containing protein [Rhodocyclaceae bacterium]